MAMAVVSSFRRNAVLRAHKSSRRPRPLVPGGLDLRGGLPTAGLACSHRPLSTLYIRQRVLCATGTFAPVEVDTKGSCCANCVSVEANHLV
eukprot:4985914-Pleurochrysis_carterae.AAC.2